MPVSALKRSAPSKELSLNDLSNLPPRSKMIAGFACANAVVAAVAKAAAPISDLMSFIIFSLWSSYTQKCPNWPMACATRQHEAEILVATVKGQARQGSTVNSRIIHVSARLVHPIACISSLTRLFFGHLVQNSSFLGWPELHIRIVHKGILHGGSLGKPPEIPPPHPPI